MVRGTNENQWCTAGNWCFWSSAPVSKPNTALGCQSVCDQRKLTCNQIQTQAGKHACKDSSPPGGTVKFCTSFDSRFEVFWGDVTHTHTDWHTRTGVDKHVIWSNECLQTESLWSGYTMLEDHTLICVCVCEFSTIVYFRAFACLYVSFGIPARRLSCCLRFPHCCRCLFVCVCARASLFPKLASPCDTRPARLCTQTMRQIDCI